MKKYIIIVLSLSVLILLTQCKNATSENADGRGKIISEMINNDT